MSNTDQTFKASGARPSRRSVVKGAAWAVPAIAVAATVPMAAASVSCLTFSVESTACKWPGQSTNVAFGYNFTLCVTSTCPDITSVTITSLSVSGQSGKTLTPCSFTFPSTITLVNGKGCLPDSNYKGDASGNWITINGYQNNSGTIVPLGQVAAPTQTCSGTTPTCVQ